MPERDERLAEATDLTDALDQVVPVGWSRLPEAIMPSGFFYGLILGLWAWMAWEVGDLIDVPYVHGLGYVFAFLIPVPLVRDFWRAWRTGDV